MASAPPWTDADDQRLIDLHAAGMTLNAIAKEMDRSTSTIHKYAERAGLSWDRSQTQAATEAKKIDAAARRADLELLYLEKATGVLSQLDQPATVLFLDVKNGRVLEHPVPRPQPADQRNIAQASATMANAANRLRDITVDTETSAVDKWTAAMLGRPEPTSADSPEIGVD